MSSNAAVCRSVRSINTFPTRRQSSARSRNATTRSDVTASGATSLRSGMSGMMRDIWRATQADRALQKLDEEDGADLAGLLGDTLGRIEPKLPATALASFS